MLSVIIPMYNEKAIISSTIVQLTDALEKITADSSTNFPFEYELLLSDDGSTDGCGAVAEETIKSLNLNKGTVRVIRAEKNAGKGGAVRQGMLASKGDIVLFTDSDLAYGCDIIEDMYSSIIKSDADMLIGSRAIHPDGYAGYTFMRKLASKTFVWLLAKTAGFSHTDSQSGIKAFKGETARRIFKNCEVSGWAFDFEVLLIAGKMGCKIEEFPVTVINHRESKVHLMSDSFKMMADVHRIKKRINSLKI